MAMTAEQKKQYQKEYMRQRRSNTGLTDGSNIDGSNSEGLTDQFHEDSIADILAGLHNPGTRTVALSDGQQWSPDLRTSQVMDSYANGTAHQRTLHALYSQYCIIRGATC